MQVYSPCDFSDGFRIALMGVGGAGSNVLHLIPDGSVPGCSIYSVNADARLLEASSAPHKIRLGSATTYGLGSGGDPAVGARAAKESAESLVRVFESCRIAVMIAGLGGGTASGALPEMARLAKEKGVFLVSVLIMPFEFEGERRNAQARSSLANVSLYSDIVIVFENDSMGSLLSRDGLVHDAFNAANRLMVDAVMAVPMLASRPGLIHLGLDDLKSAVSTKGHRCLFGCAKASQMQLPSEVVRQMMASPLLSGKNVLEDVRDVLVHVSGGKHLSFAYVQGILDELREVLPEKTHIHFGIGTSSDEGDDICAMLFSSSPAVNSSINHAPAPVPVSFPKEEKIAESVQETLLERVVEMREKGEEKQSFPEVRIITSPIDPVDDISSGAEVEEVPSLLCEAPVDVLDAGGEIEFVTEKKAVRVPPPASEVTLESKGRFDGDSPFIVDGEDFDLPPSMRRKK